MSHHGAVNQPQQQADRNEIKQSRVPLLENRKATGHVGDESAERAVTQLPSNSVKTDILGSEVRKIGMTSPKTVGLGADQFPELFGVSGRD